MNNLQDINKWVDQPAETFIGTVLDAFQYHPEFEHPLYDVVATGSKDWHSDLMLHGVMLWRMSKLARLQLTQMSLPFLDELSAENPSLGAQMRDITRLQIDQTREALHGFERLVRTMEIAYGSAKLPDLLQIVEEDTLQRFFDRLDGICWSERFGWALASDASWLHGAPAMAAGLARLGLKLPPADNPFLHPGRFVLSTHRAALSMLMRLTTAERRLAFARGVQYRNGFHREIWDGFARQLGARECLTSQLHAAA